jgi:hypothetical protein
MSQTQEATSQSPVAEDWRSAGYAEYEVSNQGRVMMMMMMMKSQIPGSEKCRPGRCAGAALSAWPKKYIAQWFGVSRPTISYIASGHTWATA